MIFNIVIYAILLSILETNSINPRCGAFKKNKTTYYYTLLTPIQFLRRLQYEESVKKLGRVLIGIARPPSFPEISTQYAMFYNLTV